MGSSADIIARRSERLVKLRIVALGIDLGREAGFVGLLGR
jgi:hypothetical protein